MQGTTSRGPAGEPLEAFDIILRGGLGKDAAIGKPILRRVPSRAGRGLRVAAVRGLISNGATPNETFTHFCVRTADAELISIASGDATGAEAAA